MDNIMIEKLWTFDARGTNDPVTRCLEALTSVGMLSDVEAGRTSVLEREADEQRMSDGAPHFLT